MSSPGTLFVPSTSNLRIHVEEAGTRPERATPQHGLHTVSMRKKYGKFYADWRDANGKRHMKAFPTKKKARAYTARMRKIEAAKKAQAPRRSRSSSRPGRKAGRKATHGGKRSSASTKSLATSSRAS